MPDRGPAELRDGLDVVASRDEVDRDRVLVAGYGERRGLAGRLDECHQMRPRDLSHVEPGEERVGEMDDPQAEAIAAVASTRSTSPEAASVPS